MSNPTDFRAWTCPGDQRAVVWEVAYHRPGVGSQITMAFPEQVERIVRTLAGDLIASGGQILSITAIGADGERIDVC